MRIVAIALSLLIFAPQMGAANDDATPVLQKKVIAVEKAASPEAEARKAESERILEIQDVPVNPFLPTIADSTQTNSRTHEAFVRR